MLSSSSASSTTSSPSLRTTTCVRHSRSFFNSPLTPLYRADLHRRRVVRRPIHPLLRPSDPRLSPPSNAPQRSPHRQRLDRSLQPIPGLSRLCAPGGRDQGGFGRGEGGEEGGQDLPGAYGRESQWWDGQDAHPSRDLREDLGRHYGLDDPVVRCAFPSFLHRVQADRRSSASVNGQNMCVNNYDVRLTDTHPACGMNWPPDLHDMYPYLGVRPILPPLLSIIPLTLPPRTARRRQIRLSRNPPPRSVGRMQRTSRRAVLYAQ